MKPELQASKPHIPISRNNRTYATPKASTIVSGQRSNDDLLKGTRHNELLVGVPWPSASTSSIESLKAQGPEGSWEPKRRENETPNWAPLRFLKGATSSPGADESLQEVPDRRAGIQ